MDIEQVKIEIAEGIEYLTEFLSLDQAKQDVYNQLEYWKMTGLDNKEFKELKEYIENY